MKQVLPSGTNRRAGPRKILRGSAKVVLPDDRQAEVKTWDLGADGLSLMSPRPIAPGSKCRLTFEVPLRDRRSTVTVPAKVVYSSFSGPEGFKVGAVFTELDDSSAQAISEFATDA
jgi:hypothetical protein